MSAQGIITTVIAIIVAAILMSTITWQIDVVEPYYTSEPYHYELTLVRQQQVTKPPWFWQTATQAQYLVKNTEDRDGSFTLNFLFDDGTNTRTKTMKVEILAGEERAVTITSPFAGESTISLSVVPPNKSELQYRTVKKTVSAWYYLPGLKFLFGW